MKPPAGRVLQEAHGIRGKDNVNTIREVKQANRIKEEKRRGKIKKKTGEA